MNRRHEMAATRWLSGFAFGLLIASQVTRLHAQAGLAADGWSGQVQCELRVQMPGYQDVQTHTWVLSGAAPIARAGFRDYPATWTVSGNGSRTPLQGLPGGAGGASTETWTRSGSDANAYLTIFEPIGTRNLRIAPGQIPLRASAGLTVITEVRVPGGATTPISSSSFDIDEWRFPYIDAVPTAGAMSGSRTQARVALVGWRQPAGAPLTETCTWSFTKGGAAPAGGAISRTPNRAPGTSRAGTVGGSPVVGATPPPAGGAPTGPVTQPVVATALPSPVAVTTLTPPPPAPAQPPAVTEANSRVNFRPGMAPGGGFDAVPTTAVTAATAKDPANFRANQTGEGTVLLTWDAVPGAESYMLGGPGTNVGMTVTGTSHTLTGVQQGNHTWTVATMYNPGGILTAANQWSRAAAIVSNTSARYRVTIAGFRVFRPTFDERINGNGDEVYAAAGVTVIDRRDSSILESWTIVKSDSYGDVNRNPGYVRAGSFGASGGLQAQDFVPDGRDPRMTPGTPSATRFPVRVWEGTLRDGIDAVVIKPTLWEIDGGQLYYAQWANPQHSGRGHPQLAGEQSAAATARATQGDLTPFRGVIVFSCASADVLQPDCSPGDDRPIGINQDGCIGNPRALAWCDLTLVLTREAADRTLAAPFVVDGVPPGLITISLRDRGGVDPVRGGLDGEYNPFLRVERLP
jgi:hypothetical protein